MAVQNTSPEAPEGAVYNTDHQRSTQYIFYLQNPS